MGGDVLEGAVGLAAEHPLVAFGRPQGTQMGEVGPDLDVVELLLVDIVGDVLPATVPRHLVARVAAVQVGRQVGDFAWRGIASHEADTGDVVATEGQHPIQCQGVEGTPRVSPQIGTVAPRTAAGTAGDVDGQRGFVGNLLEDDVGIEVFEQKGG